MRRIALLLAVAAGLLPLTTASARAPQQAAARDWRTNVLMLPSGAYAIGNPAAKVKLVEYLSFTCPHCAHFVASAKAGLHDDMVRRGAVRVEFRHAVRDPLDMAATLLARCAGVRGFVGAGEAIFAAQQSWYEQGAQWWSANAEVIKAQPQITQLKGAANGSGLTQLLRGRGMTPAAINQCFAKQTDLKRVAAMTKASWAAIQGTPSFTINGGPVLSGDWATIEPQLRAAAAR